MFDDRLYETLNETLRQKDILSFLDKLEDFVFLAENCEEQRLWVNNFYAELALQAYMKHHNFIFGQEQDRYIQSGNNAVLTFMKDRIPQYRGPKRSLKALRAFIDEMRTLFKDPVGDRIEEDTIEEIMAYLDAQYAFSSHILKNPPTFLLLNNSHYMCNSEYCSASSMRGIEPHFYLYHLKMKPCVSETIILNPVYILFHELGHALYLKYSDYKMEVPAPLIDAIATISPAIKQRSLPEQLEVIADTFAMGMMYQSPFESFDPFPFSPEQKKVFHELTKKVIDAQNK